jgi:CDP-diglyceride synthetase
MGPHNLLSIAKVLFLVAVANGAPIIAKRFLRNRMASPIDGGRMLNDGQPLFGKSKTVRGIVFSLVLTVTLAPLVHLSFLTGAMISAAAMIGDLFSSFLKRRLKIAPSGMAVALDQIPEVLLPALVARWALPLALSDISAIVLIFFVAQLFLSRIFSALQIRDEPY